VLRVTGLNAMVGFIYDFIGRPPNDGEDRGEAESAKKSDNTPQS
jgi:hypothetical protein